MRELCVQKWESTMTTFNRSSVQDAMDGGNKIGDIFLIKQDWRLTNPNGGTAKVRPFVLVSKFIANGQLHFVLAACTSNLSRVTYAGTMALNSTVKPSVLKINSFSNVRCGPAKKFISSSYKIKVPQRLTSDELFQLKNLIDSDETIIDPKTGQIKNWPIFLKSAERLNESTELDSFDEVYKLLNLINT